MSFRFHSSGTAVLVLACLLSLQGQAQPQSDRDLAAEVIKASPYTIRVDDALREYVIETATSAAAENCASCHGENLEGGPGVPNLVDFEWLWGIDFTETNDVGPVREIEQTILYGVRHEDCPELDDVSYYGVCADTRFSQMPAYGELEVFNEEELHDITQYTLSLSGNSTDSRAAERGEALWPVCRECHGTNGEGYKPYGGPDLTDNVWLFGSDAATVADVIDRGREQVCPAWVDVLDPATIKSLAVYIWYRSNMIF